MATYNQPKTVKSAQAGKVMPFKQKSGWTPLDGVSLGTNAEVKTSGVKIRGTGAATKGTMARGPMA